MEASLNVVDVQMLVPVASRYNMILTMILPELPESRLITSAAEMNDKGQTR
jgi:hypothetical protein